MINRVGNVCIFVSNQDAAKAFYTEKLGFELRMDAPLGPDTRWIAVAPKGAETEVILYKVDENWEHYRQVVGKSQAVTFSITDIDAFVADMKAKGVVMPMGIMSEAWGRHTFIMDQDNNMLLMVEETPRG